MDVDGTLTDGKIYMSANGEMMKAFNIKDGYALAHIREYGIEPVIITGRKSEIVKQRCAELRIDELHQGIENKLFKLREICRKRNISLSQVAYIGDDVNDLPCIQQCGSSACPSDSVQLVKDKVDYVCSMKGGEGAVREYVAYIIDNFADQESSNKNFEFHDIVYEVDPNLND